MLGSWDLTEKVNIETGTLSFGSSLGPEPIWSVTESDVWCAVTQATIKVTTDEGAQKSIPGYRLAFRGPRTFNYASTRFIWNGRRLRPIQGPSQPGRPARDRRVAILCVDETADVVPEQP